MLHDYRPKGVQFYYIYKSLAHPEHNGFVTPYTLAERLAHVKEAKRTLGTQFAWIVDDMDNRLKHALGDQPNSEFVVDSEGRIVRKRAWSDPERLRQDLAQLVGPSAKVTRPGDVKLPKVPTVQAAATGVVRRLEVPAGMRPVRVEPQLRPDGAPFYVKLRAEAEGNLLGSGTGKLYLCFTPDPIYHVHWNNLTKPIRVKVEAPSAVRVAPATLEGPKVSAAADCDPREFLLEVGEGRRGSELTLVVQYFACNDAEGWCKALEQQYRVKLEFDRDGGTVRRQGGRDVARRGGPRQVRPGPGGDSNVLMGKIVAVDKDQTITVRTLAGESVTVAAASASVERGSREETLAALRTGDRVRIELESGSSERRTARRIRAAARP